MNEPTYTIVFTHRLAPKRVLKTLGGIMRVNEMLKSSECSVLEVFIDD